MILHKTILILEDNLPTLSKLLEKLAVLEDDQPYDFTLIVLTSHKQVEKYINSDKENDVDIILLDRDCKLAGSFHVLEIERIGPEKVISISSVPDYNEQAKKRGVTRVVPKDYTKLEEFSDAVVREVSEMIRGTTPNEKDIHRVT